jgi:hypothetical protein
MAIEAHAPTRERRFKKLFLDPEGRHLDADEIESVTALGIEIDGEIMQVDLEGFDETVLKRLIFDGLYDRLTRAVHAAKPAAASRDEAQAVIEETYAKIKGGNFKRERKSGVAAPRAFDPTRFKTAVYAAAKALNQAISDEKFERLLERLSSMSGKDRQGFIQKNFMKDPHFKTAWEAPVLAKKKAAIKKGEMESSLADLAA